MKTYSQIFTTVFDRDPIAKDVTILRAIVWKQGAPWFHDFAVFWDEDDDERIIIVAERLWAFGLLEHIVALGEHKAVLDVVTKRNQDGVFKERVQETAKNVQGDYFHAQFDVLNPEGGSGTVEGLHLLWGLGGKVCQFRA